MLWCGRTILHGIVCYGVCYRKVYGMVWLVYTQCMIMYGILYVMVYDIVRYGSYSMCYGMVSYSVYYGMVSYRVCFGMVCGIL